jgi:hypothetical protein
MSFNDPIRRLGRRDRATPPEEDGTLRELAEKLQAGFELLTEEGLDELRRRLPIMKRRVNWR